jgi:ATP synthase subunit 6
MTQTAKSTNFILDPLEQFEVFYFECIFFTNLHFFAILAIGSIFLLLAINQGPFDYRSNKPNIVLLRDKTFTFIADLIKENLNVKVILFFPVIYLTFLVIFFGNLIGMLPFSVTVTSSAVLTSFFSLTFFIAIFLVGYATHSDRFFQIFLPVGVPLSIAPFLILVEFSSYAARLVSIAVRLFANMLSGHGLLKILGSFIWVTICLQPAGPIFLYFFPLSIVFIIACLEFIIAFLQAYVFIVLACIYLNDSICIH